MDITRFALKKYKEHTALSEETIACTGILCLDGKDAVSFKNEGQGGSNIYYPAADKAPYIEAIEGAKAWGDANYETFEPVDALITQLVYLGKEKKKVKKLAKDGFKFVVAVDIDPFTIGDDVEYGATTMEGATTAETFEKVLSEVRSKYPDNPKRIYAPEGTSF